MEGLISEGEVAAAAAASSTMQRPREQEACFPHKCEGHSGTEGMHSAGAEENAPQACPSCPAQFLGEGGHGRGCSEHGGWQRWCKKTRVQGWAPRPCPSMGPWDVGGELANRAGARSRGQDTQAWQQVCRQLAVRALSSRSAMSKGAWGGGAMAPGHTSSFQRVEGTAGL